MKTLVKTFMRVPAKAASIAMLAVGLAVSMSSGSPAQAETGPNVRYGIMLGFESTAADGLKSTVAPRIPTPGETFAGEETAINAFLFYFNRDMSQAVQEVIAERDGLEKAWLAGLYTPPSVKDDPVGFFTRFSQAFQSRFKTDMVHLRTFMLLNGGKKMREPVSGVEGLWPLGNSLTFKVYIGPWVGEVPPGSRVVLSGQAVDPAAGAWTNLRKVPFLLANLGEIFVSKFPDLSEEKFREIQYRSVKEAIAHQTDVKAFDIPISNIMPKGVSIRVQLDRKNSFAYMNTLMAITTDVEKPLTVDVPDQGVFLRKLVYRTEPRKLLLQHEGDPVIQLTLVAPFGGYEQKRGVPPYLAITFGDLDDRGYGADDIDDKLPPVQGRAELKVHRIAAWNRTLRLPYISGYVVGAPIKMITDAIQAMKLDLNAIIPPVVGDYSHKLENQVGLNIFLQRLLITLAPSKTEDGKVLPPLSLATELPSLQLDHVKPIREGSIRTEFRFAVSVNPKLQNLPLQPLDDLQHFEANLTEKQVIPALNDRLQGMLKDLFKGMPAKGK